MNPLGWSYKDKIRFASYEFLANHTRGSKPVLLFPFLDFDSYQWKENCHFRFYIWSI